MYPHLYGGWLNSLAVRHFTCDSMVVSSFPAVALLGSNLGHVVHTHMPQFNLVLV